MPLYTRGGQSAKGRESKVAALSNVYICRITYSTLALKNLVKRGSVAKLLEMLVVVIHKGRTRRFCVIIRL